MSTTLRERISLLCDDLAAIAEPEFRLGIDAVRAAMGEKLRLAVVGNVSTGKSTIVNALVRRRVAPTAAGETTKVVTWYQHGYVDSATIEFVDGTTRRLPFDRELPTDLGLSQGQFAQVTRLRVQLVSPRLKDLTVIDTPGLASLTPERAEATRTAVLGYERDSQHAAGEADALLYTFLDAARETDIGFLAGFRAASGDTDAEAVNTIGVFAQADRPRDPDPIAASQVLADALAADHVSLLADVVAVSGLLEQSGRTGQITEDVARTVAALADVGPARLRAWTRLTVDGVDTARIREAGELLQAYGLIAGGKVATRGAAALRDWCLGASGFARLDEAIYGKLVPRSQAIKARAAMRRLTDLGRRMDRSDEALTLIEEAELDPALHGLEELRMLQRLLKGLPGSSLRRTLEQMIDAAGDERRRLGLSPEATPADIRTEALRRCREAQATAALALDSREEAAALVLARSYQYIASSSA